MTDGYIPGGDTKRDDGAVATLNKTSHPKMGIRNLDRTRTRGNGRGAMG